MRSNKSSGGQPESARLAVGKRVVTHAGTGSSGATESGVIVEDFGGPVVERQDYGRDWAITKRWAISLDSGGLVFRDDAELEPES